jgi:colanic acid/amylovoran biosynthesis glycosyltransferase
MRVLMVVVDFPALSETFVLDQITGLIDRGFEVDILAAGARKESEVHADVEAYGLLERVRYVDWMVPSGSRLLQWALILLSLARQGQWRLLKEAVRVGLDRRLKRPSLVGAFQLLSYADALAVLPVPDIVLCHFGPNGDLMARLRKAFNAAWPVATFFHGYDISVLLDKNGPGVYHRLFRAGDLFLPASGFFRKRLVDLGAPADRTAVQRMGVRAGAWPTRGVAGREFVLIAVGRLFEKKGFEYAIRAMAQWRRVDPGLDAKLIIIGDGPLMNKLYSMIRRLELVGLVHMEGSLPRDKIQEKLLLADAFVLPSVTAEDGDMEASPVAISEAMAAGLPVLATRHGGIPEIVDDEVTGLLVAERDVGALAEAMCRIARDRDLALRMGEAGRRKVEHELTLDRWNDVLAERIQEMASAQRSARSLRKESGTKLKLFRAWQGASAGGRARLNPTWWPTPRPRSAATCRRSASRTSPTRRASTATRGWPSGSGRVGSCWRGMQPISVPLPRATG